MGGGDNNVTIKAIARYYSNDGEYLEPVEVKALPGETPKRLEERLENEARILGRRSAPRDRKVTVRFTGWAVPPFNSRAPFKGSEPSSSAKPEKFGVPSSWTTGTIVMLTGRIVGFDNFQAQIQFSVGPENVGQPDRYNGSGQCWMIKATDDQYIWKWLVNARGPAGVGKTAVAMRVPHWPTVVKYEVLRADPQSDDCEWGRPKVTASWTVTPPENPQAGTGVKMKLLSHTGSGQTEQKH